MSYIYRDNVQKDLKCPCINNILVHKGPSWPYSQNVYFGARGRGFDSRVANETFSLQFFDTSHNINKPPNKFGNLICCSYLKTVFHTTTPV